ncbi:MAG TPA: DUF433 domain-containing protein [Pirellulales bacterium]|nr:DUF433 domain-containing protein [Pirellulales bacterium]
MYATIIDRGRGPEIAGTRITVYDILDYVRAGWHHATIAATLRLSSLEVQEAIRYIDDHHAEVSAEYQKMLDRDARGNPPEIQAKLDAAHAKVEAWMSDHHGQPVEESNGRNLGGC